MSAPRHPGLRSVLARLLPPDLGVSPGLKIDSGSVPVDRGWAASRAAVAKPHQQLGKLEYLPTDVREQILRVAPESRFQDSVLWGHTMDGVATDHRIRGFRSTGKGVIAVDAHRSFAPNPYANAAGARQQLDSTPWQVAVYRAEFQPTKSAPSIGATAKRGEVSR